MMKTLKISNLRLKYQESFILNGLNLTVHAGEILVLLGQSGSGKTSLLKILLGILTPTEGQILLDSDDITYFPPQKRNMGYVPQAQVLFPHMTVKENIMFGLKLQKFKDDLESRYQRVLQITELTELEQRHPHELSGGQQQRVALARALVIAPEFLLLDEPLSSIDATGKEELALMIRLIQQEMNTTIIYVTHNHEEARLLADRIAILVEGKIQQLGPTPLVYSQPKNYQVAQILGKENIWPIISKKIFEDKIIIQTPLGQLISHQDSSLNFSLTGIELPLKRYSLQNHPPEVQNMNPSNISQEGVFHFLCKINAVVEIGTKNYKIILRIWPKQTEILKILWTANEISKLVHNQFYYLEIPWKDFKIF